MICCPYGHDRQGIEKFHHSVQDRPDGKADLGLRPINPTPAVMGKTTTTVDWVDGEPHAAKNAAVAPRGGPLWAELWHEGRRRRGGYAANAYSRLKRDEPAIHGRLPRDQPSPAQPAERG